jgi:hypothetical protein
MRKSHEKIKNKKWTIVFMGDEKDSETIINNIDYKGNGNEYKQAV